jgi:peptide deformylase
MAIRNIVYEDNPFILKISKPVTVFDEKLWELLDDMKQTMEQNNGVGLAAVQVGVLKRVVIVSINNIFLEMINPEIIKQSGNQCGVEGCLSVRSVQGYVDRPQQVTVKAFDRYANQYSITALNEMAVVMCHEIDHTNGILFTSKMTKPFIPEDDKTAVIHKS